MDKNHKLKTQRAFEILKSGHTLWHSIVRAARLGHTATLLQLLYRMKNLIEVAIKVAIAAVENNIENNKGLI